MRPRTEPASVGSMMESNTHRGHCTSNKLHLCDKQPPRRDGSQRPDLAIPGRAYRPHPMPIGTTRIDRIAMKSSQWSGSNPRAREAQRKDHPTQRVDDAGAREGGRRLGFACLFCPSWPKCYRSRVDLILPRGNRRLGRHSGGCRRHSARSGAGAGCAPGWHPLVGFPG